MIRSLARVPYVFVFGLWFAGQVLICCRDVLVDVLTPGSSATPRVLRLPLASETGSRAAVMGALITLTPGTLTLGVVDGHHELLVHSMYHDDAETALAELRDMEARMLRAFGPLRRGVPT
ncbi:MULTISPECIES: Na+/H+ antiporter subunit E [Pseudonocardia]|uniref:Na(+)/H(+) antiporter subunit E n=2 Tax=Pseudonocardia TaxID=1847 RepID=A0A1Y2N3W6_PSEAH|nr:MULTISPECIES: Na+/H+ antiporter subunit E [Pseudonocardia]OSY42172.1 Na(+)/H(+) antiporter subunit E [Pseudonocardia autotrophica]TDN75060.1 multicomponent Na+:H+ antiporter subunit E [Pseudonocardia autotrophica]BBF99004.1 sodium:proton antiporter [Pseudonocardia autotrophica]GEC23924.1 sodium:proton antiporter [Pseudonocardia saturnea]